VAAAEAREAQGEVHAAIYSMGQLVASVAILAVVDLL
jgi:hypothetical protein